MQSAPMASIDQSPGGWEMGSVRPSQVLSILLTSLDLKIKDLVSHVRSGLRSASTPLHLHCSMFRCTLQVFFNLNIFIIVFPVVAVSRVASFQPLNSRKE